MRIALIAVALCCAPSAAAAPILLQTIEHFAALDQIPPVKTFSFMTGADFVAIFRVDDYTDEDLGVTTFTAGPKIIADFNAGLNSTMNHFGRFFSVIVGEHPVRSLGQESAWPLNLQFDAILDGGAAVRATRELIVPIHQTIIERLTMELSPWEFADGKWRATQTIKIYGSVRVPEPDGRRVATIYCVALFYLSGTLRRDCGEF